MTRKWQQGPEGIRDQLQILPQGQRLSVMAIDGAAIASRSAVGYKLLDGYPQFAGDDLHSNAGNTQSPIPELFASTGQRPTSYSDALSVGSVNLQPSATSYYIDAVGDSEIGNGTYASPFRSLSQLVTKLAEGPIGDGGRIYIAAGTVIDMAETWAKYRTNGDFPNNWTNNLKSNDPVRPVKIMPYYPRKDTSNPVIKQYAEIVTSDWTHEPTIGVNIWSLPAAHSQLILEHIFVMFGESGDIGIIPSTGDTPSPDRLSGPNQYSIATGWGNVYGEKLYVWSDGNPNAYYGRVRVGGKSLFKSISTGGLSNAEFRNITFEQVLAVNATMWAAVVLKGLKFKRCRFVKAQCIDFNNGSTGATGQTASFQVTHCYFEDVPHSGILSRSVSGTSGNRVDWLVSYNKVDRANISTSWGGWLYVASRPETLSRAIGNYGFDCRNGVAGRSLDGAFIYAEFRSANVEIIGNIAEYCGVPYLINNAAGVKVIGNAAIDCGRLAQITNTAAAALRSGHIVANNTWLFTGRRALPKVATRSGDAVIFVSNDLAGDDPSNVTKKFDKSWIFNNAIVDLSGLFVGKSAIVSTTTGAEDSFIKNNAVSGFSANAVVRYNAWIGAGALVNDSNNPDALAVRGDGDTWFVDAANGNIALAPDSPLTGAGAIVKDSGANAVALPSASGKLFDATAPDIGAVASV